MTASGAESAAGDRARTLPGAVRYAHVLDAAAVHDELDRLWAKVGRGAVREHAAGTEATDPATAAVGTDGELVVRANTLNLVAVARSREEGERLGEVIEHLRGFYPSRALILVADPERTGGPAAGLDVRVRLLERAAKGRPTVRFECVTVAGDGGTTSQLPSIASPLLVAELPDVLWWPGEVPTGDRLLPELTEVVDRLIVDTAVQPEPGACLRSMAELVQTEPCPTLSDFAWTRLTPWRQLIAQFFDQGTSRACLDGLDEVTVIYAAPRRDGGSGLSAAVLMVSWLATRLGWTATGESARGRNGWQVVLRGREPERRVVVGLRPMEKSGLGRGLAAVRLAAHGDAPGTFSVERMTPTGLMTASESPTMPRVGRMVHAGLPDEADLLSEALRSFDRDRVYEEAAAFAAALLAGETVPA